MGYTTEFKGHFELDRPLAPEHAAYLTQFSGTRRMHRDPEKAEKMADPVRQAARLPIGPKGAYFVGSVANSGQGHDDSILDYNRGNPGLWCQWVPTEDLRGIEWDGNEKFYDYEEWLVFLIEHFLKPWGYILRGRVLWRGEEFEDIGVLVVRDNEVQSLTGWGGKSE